MFEGKIKQLGTNLVEELSSRARTHLEKAVKMKADGDKEPEARKNHAIIGATLAEVANAIHSVTNKEEAEEQKQHPDD